MVATSGTTLVDQSAISAYKDRLLPLATLITPNMPEASVLLARPVETIDDLEQAAQELSETYKTSCLLKGGHLPGDGDRLDILYHEGKAHHFTASKIDIACTHGTGCTLSAAITAQLAHGVEMVERCLSFIRLGSLRDYEFISMEITYGKHDSLLKSFARWKFTLDEFFF